MKCTKCNPNNVQEIDDLTYEYDDGNKLLKVTDATAHSAGFKDGYTDNDPDFVYDDYGNLIEDRNKGITEIVYNHLNLPKKIIFDNNEFDGTIEYLYDANGTKLKKVVTDNNASPVTVETTYYIDGFQYNGNNMDFFPHAEGYVKVTHASSGGIGGGSTNYNYVFNYTDHLGNIRLRYAINPVNQWLEILEEDHYYPFGLKHNGYNAQNYVFMSLDGGPVELIPTNPNALETYKYKFGNKELLEEFGVNVYDFGARNYDPALGRWMNVDPLAEQGRRWTPYNYAFNNPIYWQDPDGMWPKNPLQYLKQQVNSRVNTVKQKTKAAYNKAVDIVMAPINAFSDSVMNGGGYVFASKNPSSKKSIAEGPDRKAKGDTETLDVGFVLDLATAYSPMIDNKLFEGAKIASDLVTTFGPQPENNSTSNRSSDTNSSTTNSTMESASSNETQSTVEVNVKDSFIYLGQYYEQRVGRRDITVEVPNNQKSIDSVKAVYEEKENDKRKEVNRQWD